jgi:hypothetical protein
MTVVSMPNLSHLLIVPLFAVLVVFCVAPSCSALKRSQDLLGSQANSKSIQADSLIDRLTFSEKNKRISEKFKHLEDKEAELLDSVKDPSKVECHKVAVWRCGHIFIRVFKFLDYLTQQETFQPRCALRNAFFTCLRVSKQQSCTHKRKRPSNSSELFRKRLADTLWSTRTCLMGVQPDNIIT